MNKHLKVSSALITENFKLHWYIPVLTFLSYFFLTIFRIVSNYGEYGLENISYYIKNALQNQNVGLVLILGFLPLITSCIVMNYYHNQNKAFFITTQPMSRSRVFNSQVLSGWIMMIAPVVLIVLLFIALYGSTMVSVAADGSVTTYQEDIVGTAHMYTIKSVLNWLLNTTATLTFFYGLFTLAGSIVGNTAMQILGSGVLSFAIPLLTGISDEYLNEFIAGYSCLPDWIDNVGIYSNPIFGMLFTGEYSNAPRAVYYLIIGIVLIAISNFAVNKANMENVGDGMIFRKIEELSAWLVGIISGLAFGLFMSGIIESRAAAISGIIIGAVIAFFIVKIITHRTVKVFNKYNFKSLGILIIIVLFLGLCLVCDVTGFSKKIPDESIIKSVDVDDMFFGYDDGYNRYDEEGKLVGGLYLSDKESIDAVLELHRYIVSSGKYYASIDGKNTTYYYGSDGEEAKKEIAEGKISERVYFNYYLKDGSVLKRSYSYIVDEESLKLADKISKLDEIKKNVNIVENYKSLGEIDSISLNINSAVYDTTDQYKGGTYYSIEIREDDIDSILKAYENDLKERSYISSEVSKTIINDEYNQLFKSQLLEGERVKNTYFEIVLNYLNESGAFDSKYITLDRGFNNVVETLSELDYFSVDKITSSGGSYELNRWYE